MSGATDTRAAANAVAGAGARIATYMAVVVVLALASMVLGAGGEKRVPGGSNLDVEAVSAELAGYGFESADVVPSFSFGVEPGVTVSIAVHETAAEARKAASKASRTANADCAGFACATHEQCNTVVSTTAWIVDGKPADRARVDAVDTQARGLVDGLCDGSGSVTLQQVADAVWASEDLPFVVGYSEQEQPPPAATLGVTGTVDGATVTAGLVHIYSSPAMADVEQEMQSGFMDLPWLMPAWEHDGGLWQEMAFERACNVVVLGYGTGGYLAVSDGEEITTPNGAYTGDGGRVDAPSGRAVARWRKAAARDLEAVARDLRHECVHDG